MLKLAGPGIDELVSGFSATVEIGGVRKVLRSADGVQSKASVVVSTVEFPAEKLAHSLLLVVNDGGNGTTCDHADWADACLMVDPALKTSSIAHSKLALPGYSGEWMVTGYDQISNGGPANHNGTLAELENGINVREYVSIYRKDGSGFFFGPVGEPLACLENRVSTSKDGAVLRIASDMSGVTVDPGESRPGKQAVLLMEPPRQALARWAEWVAKTHAHARIKVRSPDEGVSVLWLK